MREQGLVPLFYDQSPEVAISIANAVYEMLVKLVQTIKRRLGQADPVQDDGFLPFSPQRSVRLAHIEFQLLKRPHHGA